MARRVVTLIGTMVVAVTAFAAWVPAAGASPRLFDVSVHVINLGDVPVDSCTVLSPETCVEGTVVVTNVSDQPIGGWVLGAGSKQNQFQFMRFGTLSGAADCSVLEPGETCVVTVSASPTRAGHATGTLTLSAEGSAQVSVKLLANAV